MVQMLKSIFRLFSTYECLKFDPSFILSLALRMKGITKSNMQSNLQPKITPKHYHMLNGNNPFQMVSYDVSSFSYTHLR